ncbi:tetratricopeptide repeat-containing protein [Thermobifida alba]|uniref:Tetratricopeptide repeat-containing protein n=1 Tax=Thermobifida alba TaxID=53522 RepID=A0ABY4L4W4_THEAE|nr:tetratricopeptide repeat-containing protein [Thermobifida alba]UPT21107.1 tetratricopeptide repeat-containing protein [Thermobifida alba]
MAVLARNRDRRTVVDTLLSLVVSLSTAAWRAVSRLLLPDLPVEASGPDGAGPPERTAALERALAECAEQRGQDHPDTIAARNNLAGRYAATGRRDAALAQFERALDDAVRVLGEQHPLTEVIRENLALCHEDAARFAEAAHHWQLLLDQRTARLGRHATDTLLTRARLAAACRRTGRLAEAAEHYRGVLEQHSAFSAEEVEAWRLGLALTLRRAGRADEAREQLRTVLSQRSRRLGARHPRTLAVHHQLGLAYAHAGRPEEAARVLREAYLRCLAAAGDPDVRLLSLRIRRDLAAAYRAAGRARDAAALY